MEIFANVDFSQLTAVGLMTFGAVHVITMFKHDLDSRAKFILSAAIAIALGFIPAELGNIIVEKVRDGIGIALALNGGYQATSRIAMRVGGK